MSSPNGTAYFLPSTGAQALANYPHARATSISSRNLYVSGISSRRGDGTYAGCTTSPDGVHTLDISEQTAAVLQNIKTVIEGATGGKCGWRASSMRQSSWRTWRTIVGWMLSGIRSGRTSGMHQQEHVSKSQLCRMRGCVYWDQVHSCGSLINWDSERLHLYLLVQRGGEHANHKYLVFLWLMLVFPRLLARGLLIHFPRPKCLLSPPSLGNLENTWSTAWYLSYYSQQYHFIQVLYAYLQGNQMRTNHMMKNTRRYVTIR
jgi:hypothetical protein